VNGIRARDTSSRLLQKRERGSRLMDVQRKCSSTGTGLSSKPSRISAVGFVARKSNFDTSFLSSATVRFMK
jgi:hypothetical protein